ncbi:MAG: cyclomaltodextrinase N-terminal domain-containing protein [Bacteroidales bacterium]
MKRIVFLGLLFFIFNFHFGQDAGIMVEKVEPPFWWVGMTNPNLQILVYGNEVSLATIEIDYPGVEVRNIRKVENPNYLFIDLVVSEDALPGEFPIRFKVGNKLLAPYSFELKVRKPGSSSRKGFSTSDAVYLLMPDRFASR